MNLRFIPTCLDGRTGSPPMTVYGPDTWDPFREAIVAALKGLLKSFHSG